MKKKTVSRLITIGALGIIAVAIAAMAIYQAGVSANNDLVQSIDRVANDAITLTHNYQAEEAKWRTKQYDNTTMAGVIANYDPQYQALIDRANAIKPPEKYKTALDSLVKAIQTEKDSNDHLRLALLNNDKSEYELSVNLFAKSYAYSGDYDAAMRAAGM
ncbi:MAG: hypothetical protein ABI361_01025 [Nitrososphaera sp.]